MNLLNINLFTHYYYKILCDFINQIPKFFFSDLLLSINKINY